MITMLTRSGVLQAIVEKEILKTKELVEEAKREAQKEMEEMASKLLEEERNRNDSANRAMYDLFVVSFFCILAKSCTQCSFH